MQASTVLVECFDGDLIEIPQLLAFKSKTIKDQHAIPDINAVTFRDIDIDNYRSMHIRPGAPITKAILTQLFHLIQQPDLCKNITDKNSLKTLFKYAHYLCIKPLLKKLMLQIYATMDIDELKQDPDYQFYWQILRKGVYLRSLKKIQLKEKINKYSITEYMKSIEGFTQPFLDFSGCKLECLTGLRELVNLANAVEPHNAVIGLIVGKNELVKLNVIKILKLGIYSINAHNNHITLLRLPAEVPNCCIDLSNNRIKNIPVITSIDSCSYLDLRHNILDKKTKTLLTSFADYHYSDVSHRRMKEGIKNSWLFLIFIPMVYWSLVIANFLDNHLNDHERFISNSTLIATSFVGVPITFASLMLGQFFYEVGYKKTPNIWL